MKIYKVEIKETFSKSVNIEAESQEEAVDIIKYQHYLGSIILEETDFESVQFGILEELKDEL